MFIIDKVYSNKEKEKISWKKYINTDVYVECFKNLETMLCVKYSFSFSLYLIFFKGNVKKNVIKGLEASNSEQRNKPITPTSLFVTVKILN